MSTTPATADPVQEPATAEDAAAFGRRAEEFLGAANARWLDSWFDWETRAYPPQVRDLPLGFWQLVGHVVKWAYRERLIDQRHPLKHYQNIARRLGVAAAVWRAFPAESASEANAYVRKVAGWRRLEILRDHPELRPPGYVESAEAQ